MKRIIIDLCNINENSFRNKVMDIGLMIGVEYVVQIFIIPSEWYKINYNTNERDIKKDEYRILAHNLEHMDYIIKHWYSDIRKISDLEVAPCKVPENGKLTWYKAPVFIMIHPF